MYLEHVDWLDPRAIAQREAMDAETTAMYLKFIEGQSPDVIEEMGDGHGAVMIDGKMEDDASVKQCHVMVDLAKQLSARDEDVAELYRAVGLEV